MKCRCTHTVDSHPFGPCLVYGCDCPGHGSAKLYLYEPKSVELTIGIDLAKGSDETALVTAYIDTMGIEAGRYAERLLRECFEVLKLPPETIKVKRAP